VLHFKSRARPNVLLACCTKALVMYGVCFSCYLQRIKRGWIQPVSLGGDFSDILQSSLITGSLLWEKWSILHNTAVTKQWTAKWPYISNAIFRLVQMMVKRVAFVGLKEGDPPRGSVPGFKCSCKAFAVIWSYMLNGFKEPRLPALFSWIIQEQHNCRNTEEEISFARA